MSKLKNFFRSKVGTLVAVLLIIVALAVVGKAYAADTGVKTIGGDCCADLEERIAELEATAAKKGNRKVSLTVSGVVNYAILGWDDGLLGEANATVAPNGINPSRVTFAGKANLGKDWSAGFVIEVGVGSYNLLTDALNVSTSTETYVRQSAVWIKSPVGKFTLGRTAQATYRVADTSTANLYDADSMLSLCPFLGCDTGITQNLDLYSGQFLNVVRYDSPDLYGFTVSASWSNDGTTGAFAGSTENVWDVALRYYKDFDQFKFAGSVGYREGAVFPGLSPILPLPVVAFDQKTVSGSASLMHVPSGLFLDVAAGRATFPGDFEILSWEVRPGVEQRWFPIGKTTIFALYSSTKVDGLDDDIIVYGGGIVQAIDPAAMNLYATVKKLDPGNGIDEDAVLGMAGAALHF
jgi:hypothetical protein